jgi:rRNA maturation protein Rpf1
MDFALWIILKANPYRLLFLPLIQLKGSIIMAIIHQIHLKKVIPSLKQKNKKSFGLIFSKEFFKLTLQREYHLQS